MTRPSALLGILATAALLLSACGGEIEVPRKDRDLREGAVLFNERCSGCHTLEAANAEGSKPESQVSGGERTNGPNFNVRKESRDDVLYAIRNGGFSGAIMPANIVVGEDAEKVAEFLDRYAGRKKSERNENSEQQQGDAGGGAE